MIILTLAQSAAMAQSITAGWLDGYGVKSWFEKWSFDVLDENDSASDDLAKPLDEGILEQIWQRQAAAESFIVNWSIELTTGCFAETERQMRLARGRVHLKIGNMLAEQFFKEAPVFNYTTWSYYIPSLDDCQQPDYRWYAMEVSFE